MAYSRTRNQIIIAALKNVRALANGQQPTADDIAECSRRLNDVIKSFEISQHIKLWKDVWETQTLTASSVVTGSDSKIYRCIRNHTSSTTDEPGVGADYTTYWMQDAGKTSGGAWALATDYTSINEFNPPSDTIKIKESFYRDQPTGYDYPLTIVTLEEYFEISDKRWESYPSMLVFDEKLTPKCYLYPHPDDVTYVIHYLYEKALIDFEGPGDNPDFPDRWIQALKWALSAEISSMFGLSLNEKVYFDSKAEKAIRTASKGEFDGLSLGQFEGYI